MCLSVFLLLAVTSIGATNYQFTVPPPNNRIRGFVINPTVNKRNPRIEDLSYLQEMLAERLYLGDPSYPYGFSIIDWLGGGYCDLMLYPSYFEEHDMPYPITDITGWTKYVLAGNMSNGEWWGWGIDASQEVLADEVKSYPLQYATITVITNALHDLQAMSVTNLASGLRFDFDEDGYWYRPYMSGSDVVTNYVALERIGNREASNKIIGWRYVDGGSDELPPGDKRDFVHGSEVNQERSEYIGGGVYSNETITANTNYISSSDDHWTGSEGSGWSYTHIKRAVRIWWDNDGSPDNADSGVKSNQSFTYDTCRVHPTYILWDANLFTNIDNSARIGSTIYGVAVFKLNLYYTREHRKTIWYDGYWGHDYSTVTHEEITRFTNQCYVAVNTRFDKVDATNSQKRVWYKSTRSIEDMFTEILSTESIWQYGGTATSAPSFPQLPDPSEWTYRGSDDVYYDTSDLYEDNASASIDGQYMVLLFDPLPKFHYSVGGGEGGGDQPSPGGGE